MTNPPEQPRSIDLNADVGEFREALADAREEGILRVVTSANVACGGHAGDRETMSGVLALAKRLGVSIGAHPGYPDRAGFGRDSMGMAPDDVEAAVVEQLRALAVVARRLGCEVVHVKPHGALYNDAARDQAVAVAVARAVRRWRRDVALVGLAGSTALDVFASEGFRAVAECFADRAYEADGSLRSRRLPGALITRPEKAAEQAVSIARRGYAIAHGGQKVRVTAETICIHGDNPGAIAIATAVRAALESCGVAIRRFAQES